MNLAWAPGHIVGSTVGGAVADATGDAVPYLIVGALCILTLVAVHRAPASLRTPPERRRPADAAN